MSISVMSPVGNIEIPTRGGGTSLELISRISALEDRVNNLASQKLDVSNVVQGTSVTEAGYAADARQMNPAISGSLAGKVSAVEDAVSSVSESFSSRIDSVDSNVVKLSSLLYGFVKQDGRVPIYNGNLNDIKATSIYNISNLPGTNFPGRWESGSWSFIITLLHTHTDTYGTQMAIVMTGNRDNMIATRVKSAGAWQEWRYIQTN